MDSEIFASEIRGSTGLLPPAPASEETVGAVPPASGRSPGSASPSPGDAGADDDASGAPRPSLGGAVTGCDPPAGTDCRCTGEGDVVADGNGMSGPAEDTPDGTPDGTVGGIPDGTRDGTVGGTAGDTGEGVGDTVEGTAGGMVADAADERGTVGGCEPPSGLV